MKKITLFIFIVFSASTAFSQTRLPHLPPLKTASDTTTRRDTLVRREPRTAIRDYKKLINPNFTTQHGLFTVHQHKDTVYFEIPDSMLRRDMMVVNRLTKAPAGLGMYAGEELDEKTIQFVMGPDSTIRIIYDLVVNEADSSDQIYKAVVRSSVNPVVMIFPIKAFSADSSSYVIDVSHFLTDKTFINSVDPGTPLAKNLNLPSMKDIYLESVHVYPINIEISTTKNVQSNKNQMPVTMATQTSFIALPKVPMQRRYFDPRVGFFADNYYAFSDKQQRSENRQFILRWKLEPKDEDIEKWKSGALVEPKKPIVIYIDPATPKQWRPYLIQGINDWQKAFEQAGFKNAIIGKEWPEHDSTMHMDDVRYSMLEYFPSETENAYGPQVHDPRSGEIIQTHIGWYHNVMTLLHDWYMVQAGAIDPKARKAVFDEELMGQLIRFVSSHEVGHTLGLRHNFGSSSRTPVDSLRSKTYLAAHGHTASIMDYARFNYVAQPEDHITEDEIFPHIGEYDRWAIEWGYKNSFATNADEDKKIVRNWIVDRTSKNPRLWFGDGETKKFDPRCQTEDLGDDAMKASTYGIKNLQRILPNLPAWSYQQGELHENLTEMYKALKDQWQRYINHVLKNLDGGYVTLKSDDEKGDVATVIPKYLQQEVLDFFNAQMFTTPRWLLDTTVLSKINLPVGPDYISDMQARTINSLLDVKRLNGILDNMQQYGTKAFPLDQYISTVHKGIWKDLAGAGTVNLDIYSRNMEKNYVGAEIAVLLSKEPDATETDASSLVRVDLAKVMKEITAALPRATDALTRYHLQDLQYRIKTAMSDKKE